MPIVSDLLTLVSILEIWHALGGGEIRHKRGRAFWRNGDGWNVSIDPAKGCWYDFVAGQGGGILDLIQTALDCDRVSAIKWLAEFAGVPLDQSTAQERRDYARRRASAAHEADELLAWRERLTDALREYHYLNLSLYHACKRAILNGHYADDQELVDLMEEAEQAGHEWERAAAALDTWRAASWDDILKLFRRHRRYAA